MPSPPAFQPPFCPHHDCPSPKEAPFRWQRKGFYARKCDRRIVQRFRCLTCSRSFSEQTFRVDYRLRKAHLFLKAFLLSVSKVTQRQAARLLGCHRVSAARWFDRTGRHAHSFHVWAMEQHRARGGLQGTCVLDELETFEHNRRLKPVSVPTLVEKESLFVVDARAVALPSRGGGSAAYQKLRREFEAQHGKRLSESRIGVKAVLEAWKRWRRAGEPAVLVTDRKGTYRTLARKLFGTELRHSTVSSKAARTLENPLFAINHTFASMRDGVSRLVRRNWGAAKKRAKLELALWSWIGWRNYVRPLANRKDKKHLSSASMLGVLAEKLSHAVFLKWRVLHLGLGGPLK